MGIESGKHDSKREESWDLYERRYYDEDGEKDRSVSEVSFVKRGTRLPSPASR
jgi:hypothetical protein